MSAGPIRQWREAHKPRPATTPANGRICAPDVDNNRSYCGRRDQVTAEWERVTCSECHAAARADKEARA